jgi:hypothetical protein
LLNGSGKLDGSDVLRLSEKEPGREKVGVEEGMERLPVIFSGGTRHAQQGSGYQDQVVVECWKGVGW